MSTINTSGLNANYPVPGINNNSQGFRDNFATIKTNLNSAGTEITDLQNKSIVKSALANTIINNDMANTLMSNTLTRSFRASTYNLGAALSGTVIVNASLGDVQYGTIAANTIIQFAGWAPSGTQSNVQLQLSVSNSSAVVSFPSQVSSTGSFGVTTLENYANVASVSTVTAPHGVTKLDYRLSTMDCGTTISIEPINRPRQSTEIFSRTPSPAGYQGDVAGTIAVDANYVYVCTASFDANVSNTTTTLATTTSVSSNLIVVGNTSTVVLNAPIVFTGTTFGGIVAETVYYVKSIPTPGAGGTITVSDTRTAGTAGSVFPLSTASGSMTATCYKGTVIWKRTALTTW